MSSGGVRDELEQALAGEPEARKQYEKLADYKKEMCSRWIGEAETEELRERRVRRLMRYLGRGAFDPYYMLGYLMFEELDEVYGEPQPLSELSPDEQKEAFEEKRVLAAYQYRNFDDGGINFYIAKENDNRYPSDVVVVYKRPCVLTGEIVHWLDRISLETMSEVRAMFGVE